jgi:hypothetical protein
MKNCIRTIRQVAGIGLLALAMVGLAKAKSPPLWDKLPPGLYAVGYKTLWQLDYARRYNMTFDDKTTYAPGKAPRPILINLWYPASKAGDSKTMPHRAYLNIQSDDPLLAAFSIKLSEYNRAAIAFRDYYRESGVDYGKVLLQFGKSFQRMGAKKMAADYFRQVLLLEPSNGEAADKLKELAKGKVDVEDP